MIQRKTLIIEADVSQVREALSKYLRHPLLSQTGRLTCVQDPVIDNMSDESITHIATAFSVPLRAIRMLDELPTEPRATVLALPQRASGS